MNTPNKAPPEETPTTTTPLPPLVLTRNNPRLAKEGFKTFQGLAADERSMLIKSIETILNDPKDVMSKYIGKHRMRERKQEFTEKELTLEELRVLLSKIIRDKYVQLTGPPYRIKFHTTFLSRFNDTQKQEQHKTHSQDTNSDPKEEQDNSDDDSTIVPPMVIQTATTPKDMSIRTPRRENETDDQRTLTQIWTPRPTQTIIFDAADNDEGYDEEQELTNIETERRRKLAAVVNPYKSPRKPMVTPQKPTTNTKTNETDSNPRPNLKNPPAYSLRENIAQTPTLQELETIALNTERVMDQATAEFHQRNDQVDTISRMTIAGLGTLEPTEESARPMAQLIRYMEDLGNKYRRIIKEYEDNIAQHKADFKETLTRLTNLYEQQARINMEQIITTQSSNAEQKMQRQLHTLVRPQLDATTKDIIKKLDEKLQGYNTTLDNKFMEKESELISDLDHFQDRASLVLEDAMEDFYHRTVPYTVPPKLTQYIDDLMEAQITAMVKKKMDDYMDQQQTLKIQQRMDQAIDERLKHHDQQLKQQRQQEMDNLKKDVDKQLERIETATTASVQLLELKRDHSVKSIGISLALYMKRLETKWDKGIKNISKALHASLADMDENRKTMKANIVDSVNASIQEITDKHRILQGLLTDETQKTIATVTADLKKGQANLRNETEDGKNILTDDTERKKRELQRDKDRHLQALTNEKSRILNQFKDEADAAMENLKTLTHEMTNKLRETGEDNDRKRKTPSTQMGATHPNQWRSSPHPWTPDSQNQHSQRPHSQQTQYGSADDTQTQPPQDTYDNNNATQKPNRFQERVNQREQEIHDEQIMARSERIHDKIHNFKKANLEYIVSPDNPSQDEIETLYRNIAAEMRACHMPIVAFEDLTPTSGTRPKNELITPQVEFIVGKELYLMLTKSLPRSDKNLRAIMESYSQTEDGYGALNLVM
jgi:hypothetical protein